MDSMRTLKSHLPGSSPPKQPAPEPPELLLQAFKSAALSVTNLYKTATAQGDQARREGYQEAIEDLLTFLDRANLGVSDGEGWRIRQWATAKLDGTEMPDEAPSDDEHIEKRARSSSPVVQRASEEALAVPSRSGSPSRTGSAPPNIPVQSIRAPEGDFTFQSRMTLPSHMEEADMDAPDRDTEQPTLRLERVPRSTRSSKHNLHNRMATRSSSSTNNTNMKRRFPFGEFFDIGKDLNFNHPSSKRGRFQ